MGKTTPAKARKYISKKTELRGYGLKVARRGRPKN
jgi:hypothetical protein